MAIVRCMELIERDDQLDALRQFADDLGSGGGRIALIGAEAGAGKSSLLGAFAEQLPTHTVYRLGRCDELSTPASFAPLWDMAATLPVAVADAAVLRGRDPGLLWLSDRPAVWLGVVL